MAVRRQSMHVRFNLNLMLRLVLGLGLNLNLICGAHGSVNVRVLNRDSDPSFLGDYHRYADFKVGAFPGVLTTFEINFGSCAPNLLPVDALRSSTTWRQVNTNASSNVTNIVTEYLYYTGQKNLVRADFVLDAGGTIGILNTCAMNLTFCYSYKYESRELVLAEGCPLSATHMYKKAVYTGINSTLKGNHLLELYEDVNGGSSCLTDVEVWFQKAFSIKIPCDVQVVDIETYPLNIEHDPGQHTLTVYYAFRERDNTTGAIIIIVLVLFLSTWLFWTRHLHILIRFSITREQTEGNPVEFEKVLRKAIRHETILQSVKSYIFKYKDELYPFVGEEFKPDEKIDKGLAEVAATNRVMAWDSVCKFSVIVVDIIVLVGSTTFLASIDKHPTLYHDYTVELVGETFVTQYLLFWAYFFSIAWPLFIMALILYGSVIDEGFQDKTPSPEEISWFTWGKKSFKLLSIGARIAIFILVVCIIEIFLGVFWILLAKKEAYGWIFMVSCPALLFFGANLNVLRSAISPYYAHMYKYDTIVLLMVRWSVEIMILTSIHALMPESMNNQSLMNFDDGLSLALGATMTVVTGRDLTWLWHLLLLSDISRWTLSLMGIFSVCMTAVIIIHASVFLVGNIYLDTASLSHKPQQAISCSISTVVQLFSVGSIYASHKIQCWTDLKCKTH